MSREQFKRWFVFGMYPKTGHVDVSDGQGDVLRFVTPEQANMAVAAHNAVIDDLERRWDERRIPVGDSRRAKPVPNINRIRRGYVISQVVANSTNPFGMCRGSAGRCSNCAVDRNGLCAGHQPFGKSDGS